MSSQQYAPAQSPWISPPLLIVARSRYGSVEAEHLRAELEKQMGLPWALRAPDAVGPVMDYAGVVVALFGPDPATHSELLDDVSRYHERHTTDGFLIPVAMGGEWHGPTMPPASAERMSWGSSEQAAEVAARIAATLTSRFPSLRRAPAAQVQAPQVPSGDAAPAKGSDLDEESFGGGTTGNLEAAPAAKKAASKKATRRRSALTALLEEFVLYRPVRLTISAADRLARAASPQAPVSTAFLLIAIGDRGDASKSQDQAPNWLRAWLGPRFDALRSTYLGSRGVTETATPPESTIVPSEGFRAALDRARDFARRTTGAEEIHLRHLLAALLTDPRPAYESAALTALVGAGASAAECRALFLETLRGFDDDEDAWSAILGGPVEAVPRLGQFHADDARGDDLIGIDQEVTALATLISARTLRPPLSIGLFGEWGSGKSFFMRRLMHTVAELSQAARESTADGKPLMQRDLPFYKRILQIEFNAWHFVEENLWASLMSHIFQNLVMEGVPAVADEMRRGLITAVEDQAKTRDRAAEATQTAEGDLATAREQVEAAERALATKAEAVSRLTPAAVAAELPLEDVKRTLDPVLESLGVKQVGARAGELATAIQQGRAATERAWAVLSPLLYGRDRARRLIKVILVFAAAPVVGLLAALLVGLVGLPGIQSIAARAAELATFLGGLATVLARGTRWVNERSAELEEIQADYEKKLAEALEGEQKQLDDARRTLAEAEQSAAQARAAQDAAEQQLAAARTRLEEATVGRLLGDYVQARAASADYRKHLGLIGTVRDDFRKLSELIDAQNRQLDPDEPNDAAKGIRRFRTIEDEQKDEARRVNRIVLYIDDLDRCPPQKVVEVLQAVHLLLAFPLFVVVVGVDARWITRSLESHYRTLLRTGPASSPAEDGLPRPAIARDYLEKIFQVPFWLQPLSRPATLRLLNGLMGPVAPAAPAQEEPAAAQGTSEPSSDPPVPHEDAAPVNPTDARAPVDDPVPAAPPPDEVVPNPDALLINEAERRFIQAVSPLLERSPRSLKRFVNVYRLIKAGLPAHEADLFVSERPGSGYRAALFLLAVDTGLPEVAHAVFQAIEQLEPSVTGAAGLRDALAADAVVTTDHAEEWDRLSRWITQNAARLGVQFDARRLAAWAPRIERYSFRAAE